MNKQELIEDYKRISNFCETVSVNKVIHELEQLDKPERVQIPQFIADWIEACKENNIISLTGAFEYAKGEVKTWLSSWENQEFFARAWLDGYEVEEEKRYSVKIKGEIEENLLVYGLGINRYFFARTYDSSKRNEHTRKELENAGFGWVFDCKGIEVKEVGK
jgi:hypothetical protein